MTNYKIVNSTINDADIIYNLDAEYEYDRYSKDLIKDALNNLSYINLIAYKDESAVGYVSVNSVIDEGEVLKIVVAKEYRKLGIGNGLVTEVLAKLRDKGVETVFLEVRSNNIPAKRLYEKNGFVKIGERKKYYGDGADADIYRLTFL